MAEAGKYIDHLLATTPDHWTEADADWLEDWLNEEAKREAPRTPLLVAAHLMLRALVAMVRDRAL